MIYPHILEIEIKEFPSYLRFYIVSSPRNKKVLIKSSIHVNKINMMPHTWSHDFPWDRLMGDVMHFTKKAYGLTLDPTSYS